MLDTPHILETEPQMIALVRITVPRAQIREVMGPGREELIAAVAAQGAGPTGPWFTHHLKMDPNVFDFEICVPVSRRIAPAGRVKPAQLRAMRAVRTIYRGGYEGLGDAWGEFLHWIDRQGLKPRRDLLERYLTGPEASDDPADWQTELTKPLLTTPARKPTQRPKRKAAKHRRANRKAPKQQTAKRKTARPKTPRRKRTKPRSRSRAR